jgi:hypothetical protein
MPAPVSVILVAFLWNIPSKIATKWSCKKKKNMAKVLVSFLRGSAENGRGDPGCHNAKGDKARSEIDDGVYVSDAVKPISWDTEPGVSFAMR